MKKVGHMIADGHGSWHFESTVTDGVAALARAMTTEGAAIVVTIAVEQDQVGPNHLYVTNLTFRGAEIAGALWEHNEKITWTCSVPQGHAAVLITENDNKDPRSYGMFIDPWPGHWAGATTAVVAVTG